MNENAPPGLKYPWYVALVAARPERAKAPTALEDALLSAVERAIHDRRHPLHQQTFGFYDVPGAGHRRSHARQISQSDGSATIRLRRRRIINPSRATQNE
jgi:hypothetical protein